MGQAPIYVGINRGRLHSLNPHSPDSVLNFGAAFAIQI